MYQYDNGFKLEKKMNNWEHLQKFFKRKAMAVDFNDYDPVIHCAPDAAYKLLKKFYQVLTGREYVHYLFLTVSGWMTLCNRSKSSIS
jgi:hypothetical protein